MGIAAEVYTACFDARSRQYDRIFGQEPADRWGGEIAQRLSADPRRTPSPNLEVIAAYITTDDTVIDVGGGAGRLSLPLALRCCEVVNVDGSAGMGEAFATSARDAGIANARFIHSDWLKAGGVQGDVCIAAHVTYFVREIVPFVQKLEQAAKRRVMILVGGVAPPNQGAEPFRLVHGEEQAPVPAHRELLPVLWQMGILPDVRVLPEMAFSERGLPRTKEEALRLSGQGVTPAWALPRLGLGFEERAQRILEAHFDELFQETPGGFRRRLPQDARELLITWESRGKGGSAG